MAIDIGEFEGMSLAWRQIVPGPELHRDRKASQRADDMASMQGVQSDLAARGLWTYGRSDLMAVLGIERREVAQCRVLRWLLDPLARHGLGAGMVAALGSEIGAEISHPQRARSEAEVARARSRADVVVTGAGSMWTVVIEAKIGAGEGPEQGFRLEQDWLEDETTGMSTTLVFLTIGGARTPMTARQVDRWVPLSWAWVVDATSAVLAGVPDPGNRRAGDARHSVECWLATARRSLR